MTDIAEEMHRSIFGVSGRANAPENDNPAFRSGFKTGSRWYPEFDGVTIIGQAYEVFGKELTEANWGEWRRGMWAAIMQKATANLFDT